MAKWSAKSLVLPLALLSVAPMASISGPVSAYDSVEITPPGELTGEDMAAIDALALEFIDLTQTDSVLAAMLMITESHLLGDQVTAFSELVEEQCPVWDSVSEGEAKTLSRDMYQRDYYFISEKCAFRLRFHFGRSNGRWRILSAIFLSPQVWH